MEKYLCKNCKYKKHQCYVCGKLGTSDETLGAEREVKLNFHLFFGCRVEQENGRTMRLCPSLRKISIVSVCFSHANPWLFIISITKPFLDFVHLLKCGSRTKATHLSRDF